MKKLSPILCAVSVLFALSCSAPVSAASETPEAFDYELRADGTVEITGYNGSADTLAIPSTLDSYSVTRIGWGAFEGCASLKSVTIPATVTDIGEYAFSGCTALTDVDIPDSVIFIEEGAFSGCASLTSIYIPASVKSISYRPFADCPSLTTITVDENNPVFDSRGGCNAIFVTKYNGLIVGCRSTTIPDSTAYIADHAFEGCSTLTDVTIPDSITFIDEGAFYGCTSLKDIAIPESVTYIGMSAFAGCTALAGVTIPDSVTEIDEAAFFRCPSLKSVVIPASVNSIGAKAFGYVTVGNETQKTDGFTIRGEKGSAAEKYAEKNGFAFVPTAILGDVDSDGEVTIIDATAIQRVLADLPTQVYNADAADADGDG